MVGAILYRTSAVLISLAHPLFSQSHDHSITKTGPMSQETNRSLIYGFAAYGLWGVIPIYFKILNAFANSYDMLAHRIVWSAAVLVIVLTIFRRWGQLWQALTRPRSLIALLASSILIGLNWFIYIYSIETKRVMQSSLGYFITPLVNVAFGVFLLDERFRRTQGVALGFGVAGLIVLMTMTDEFPWIALALTCTFSSYGLFRKFVSAETLVGLAAETFFLTPICLWYLFAHSTAWQATDSSGQAMLILSGPATIIPLFCFGQAARMLPFTYLGFLQYISPSLQFLIAVFLFGEPLSSLKLAAFSLVWVGLIIVTVDALRARRLRLQHADMIATEEGTVEVAQEPAARPKL
jgi:chloramphenicol-sensitive protein RarD